MLWTDGPFISTKDLRRVDSEIEEVSRDENAPLVGDYGILRGAWDETGQEMNKILVAFGGYLTSGDVSPNHVQAVMNIGLGNSVRQKASLSAVVVSGVDKFSWNHVKQWAVHFTLLYFYRDVFNRTTKDRYEAKMRYYKSEMDRRLRPGLLGLGIPLIINPMARPAATGERSPIGYASSLARGSANTSWGSSGSWGARNLSATAGSASGGIFDVVITYVNQGPPTGLGTFRQDPTKYVSFDQNGNAESAPTEVATIELAPNELLTVNIGSLNPPNGFQDPRTRISSVVNPLAATGWNLYVAVSGENPRLQNAAPISLATPSVTLASDPTTSGIECGVGQFLDRILALAPTRQRA